MYFYTINLFKTEPSENCHKKIFDEQNVQTILLLKK